MSIRFPMTVLAVAAVVSVAAFANGANEPNAASNSVVMASTTSTIGPSGLPVPRFVSLKKAEVRARFGPSFDYPVAYEFRRQGLPLKVIAEDRDNIWRRVEDRDGRRMWIHRSMLSPNHNAVVIHDAAVLRTAPRDDSAGRAKLAGGVMVKIETCTDGWCRLKANDFRGWLPQTQLWGTDA